MDWAERAENLLYDGEAVEAQVRVGEGGVVVTSHRVLAFTPDREGSNYRAVDRPNVNGASVTSSGEFQFLQQAIKAIVVGVVLVGAGMTVSLDGLVSGVSLDSGGAAGTVGLGQMMGLLQTLLSLLGQLDDLMRIFGALALVFGAVVLGVYIWSRERLLVVGVAGEDDIELTAPENEEAVLQQLKAALLPGDAPPGAVSESTPDEDPPGNDPPGDDPLA
jgi:hypothetical protein